MLVGRPRSTAPRASAVLLAVTGVLAAFAGCYKPSVTDNGFLCATSGKQCPDGYKCGFDGHCSLNPAVAPPPPHDSGMEVKPMPDASMMTDGGGGEPMCVAPTAVCADGPTGSDVCSPSCQRGCGDCGRCNVVDGKPACVSAGTVKLGDVCNANADNCAAGLICLLETCGNGLARCYQHCTTGQQCHGMACTITIDDNAGAPTPYLTCDVPPHDCNPLVTGAASGCPNPALNCYLASVSETLCDCPGAGTPGGNNAECTIYSDCAPGFICIAGVDMQVKPHCHYVCDVANPSCPTVSSGDGGSVVQHCVAPGTGAKYGFCASM